MYVMKTVVISLPEAVERRKQISTFLTNYEIYMPKRDTIPIRGCFNSHQEVIRIAKKEGKKYLMVLEDDAYPLLLDWRKYIKFPENKDWKYLLLGCLPIRLNPSSINLYESRCSFDAHAYIVNLDNVNTTEWTKDKTIDGELFCNGVKQSELYKDIWSTFSEYNRGVYVMYPMLFKQQTEISYINNFDLLQKYFFKFWGYNGSIVVGGYMNTVVLGLIVIILKIIYIIYING